MNRSGESKPPLYGVFKYAMEHFGEFLELVAWVGEGFGTIQVKGGGSWWKKGLNGPIR